MFEKISIIGCGLIGSSILRVIIKKKIGATYSSENYLLDNLPNENYTSLNT